MHWGKRPFLTEAVRLLKDKNFSANLSHVLRKLKPNRQVECVELMVATNNITVAYAPALLAASPSNMLVNDDKPKKIKGVTEEQMSKMEREMSNLEGSSSWWSSPTVKTYSI